MSATDAMVDEMLGRIRNATCAQCGRRTSDWREWIVVQRDGWRTAWLCSWGCVARWAEERAKSCVALGRYEDLRDELLQDPATRAAYDEMGEAGADNG